MDYNLNEFISKLTDFLKNEAKTETVIGEQFQLGEFKCVPVMGIGMGLGAGGGEGKDPKQAAGAGLGGGVGFGMAPVGFLVARDQAIQFVSAKQAGGLNAMFEKIPGVLDKLMQKEKSASV